MHNQSIDLRTIVVLMCIVCVAYAAVLGIVLRAAFVRGIPIEQVLAPGGDAAEYVALARTIHTFHRYALSPESPPEFFRSPGYPAFAAALLSIRDSVLVLIAGQILLMAVAASFVLVIGSTVFSRPVGIVATFLFVADPTVISNTLQTLTEPLFMAIFVAAVWSVLETISRRRLLLAGVLVGCLVLIRPLGLFLAPLFLVWIAYRSRTSLKHALSATLIFSVACAAVFTPWMTRNAVLSGHFALSSISGYNMLFYNVVEFEAQRGVPKDTFIASLYQRLGTNDSFALRSFSYTQQEGVLVREYIGQHLISYAIFHILKTAPFFIGSSIDTTQRTLFSLGLLDGSPPPAVNISGLALSGNVHAIISETEAHPWEMGERIGWLLIATFAFGEMLWLLYRKDQRWAAALFFVLLIMTLAILTGPVSQPRYRIPAEPFLFLLSAAGVHASITAIRQRVRRTSI